MDDSTNNPFAPPVIQSTPQGQYHKRKYVEPAGKGARLGNFLIDYATQYAISFGVIALIVFVFEETGLIFLESLPGKLLGIPIVVSYYFILEVTTGKTLGKLVTGTKVVDEHGQPATAGQILGRSFCRLIPFEAFSFLGNEGRGWHDTIPKTYVVKTRF